MTRLKTETNGVLVLNSVFLRDRLWQGSFRYWEDSGVGRDRADW